jgi:hypothetical protein
VHTTTECATTLLLATTGLCAQNQRHIWADIAVGQAEFIPLEAGLHVRNVPKANTCPKSGHNT